MRRPLRWHDYITINIYWFALTTRAQSLTPLIIPLLVQEFVGEAKKGTYVGRIRLWALMVAVLVQALMGLVSDRSTLRWGRRRPFIVLGTLSELVVFALIGASARLHGIRGHRALFAAYALSMITSNTAHTATQGLIPDLVPADQHGRFSGVKVLLELPFPLVFVSLVVGRLVSGGSLWGALLALMGVLVVCMLATLFVPEVPLEKAPPAIDWRPFVRLLIVTGAFTAIILSVGAGVNKLMQVLLVPSGASGTLPTALVGLAGMVVAVLVGVWASVRISLGEEASDASSFTWWVVNWLTFLVATAGMSGFYAIFPAGALREPSGRSRRRASIHPDDARGHLLVDGCCARRLAGRSCREEAAALGERRAGYSRNPGRGRRAEPGGSIRRRVPDRCLDRAVLLCELGPGYRDCAQGAGWTLPGAFESGWSWGRRNRSLHWGPNRGPRGLRGAVRDLQHALFALGAGADGDSGGTDPECAGRAARKVVSGRLLYRSAD